jgi:hypothetical protein
MPNEPSLKNILEKAGQAKRHGRKSLAVFDLDSTLFDVSPRLTKILHDYADDPLHQKQFPESTRILRTLSTKRSDWGIKQAVIRAGLDKHHPEFHDSLRAYWRAHFFSDEYLQYDVPYEGAVDFVTRLAREGSEIVYLTGRDIARMGKGSREILLKWKFPLDESHSRLILKPEKGMDDAEFKSDWFRDQPLSNYDIVWFFENEPVNIDKVRADHPQVKIVFFASTHSGRAEPPGDLPHIFHFLLSED